MDILQIGADKLQVNLVLGVRQEDEARDDAGATAALDLGGDLAVPDVVVVGEEGADAVLGHVDVQVAVLHLGEAAVGPIGLGGIAQVLGVEAGVVEVVPLVGGALAGGFGGARVEGEGEQRVTAAETEATRTTFAVFWRLVRERERETKMQDTQDSREQQGYFSGHCLSALHLGASPAQTEVAKAASSREEVMRTMMTVYVILSCLKRTRPTASMKKGNNVSGRRSSIDKGIVRGGLIRFLLLFLFLYIFFSFPFLSDNRTR